MYLDEDVAAADVLLGQVAEHTPDVLWMFAADWSELVFINGSYEEIWGRPVADLAEDPSDFIEGVHPDFHDEVRDAMERLSAGHSIEQEYRVNADSGYDRWVLAKGEPVTEDGEVVRVAGFVRDITDRVRQERELERRERALRELHAVTSDTHLSFEERIERLLEFGCEVIGTATGTLSRVRGDEYVFEVVHTPDDDVAAGDRIDLAATNCELVATDRQTVVMGDIDAEAPDLAEKSGYVDMGIRCYLGAPVVVEDEVYGTLCFYDQEPAAEAFDEWDVTLVELMAQWTGYELTRRRTRERLERQNERFEEYASVVSHDLRNPLNVAMARLELARADPDGGALDAVSDALDRMEAIIGDALELARHGPQAIDPEPVDLSTVVRSATTTVPTDGMTVEQPTDARIVADLERLRQLLENLLRNALEHGGDGVTVEVGTLDGGFYVADDGPGIPPDRREAVFEPGHSTAEDGTGFGLSIVREIANGHGWTVDVTDSEAGGARFGFRGVEFATG